MQARHMRQTSSRGTVGIAALAVTVLCWAGAFVATRIAIVELSPLNLATLRISIAATIFAICAVGGLIRVPPLTDVLPIGMIGVIGFAVYNLLLNTAQQTVGAGTTALILASGPAISTFLAVMFLGEVTTRRGWLGVLVGLCGAGIVIASGARQVDVGSGALIAVLAAVAQSIQFVLQKRYMNRYSPLQITAVGIWVACVPLLSWNPTPWSDFLAASMRAQAATVFLGVFASALGYVAFAYASHTLSINRAVGSLALVPPVAVVGGWLVLGEALRPTVLLGGTIALAGVVMLHRSRRPTPLKAP